MLFPLLPQSIHTNSGNSFSRAFLFEENFKGGKNLLIFDTRKEAESFAKILALTTKEPIFFVFSLPQVIDFFSRENGWFVTTKELFEMAINSKYYVQKNSILLERNEEVSPDISIDNLINS